MTRTGRHLLTGAAACGLVHAGFSVYWATGGTWLLETVGTTAVEAVRAAPLGMAATLTLIGLVKSAGAVVPWLASAGRIPGRRAWRAVSAVGGGALLLYGGLNTAVAWAVLLELVDVPGGYDRSAQIGHAVLWDPLFLLWGLLLTSGLWATRRAAEQRRGVPTVHDHANRA